jgi:hypothetical protein
LSSKNFGLEEAHSRFLAWLLNPAEAHGLGDEFLRRFMAKVIGTEPRSLVDVTVTPEFRCGGSRFDIHVKGDRWCLVVENKVDDPPWDDQCGKYQEYCRKLTDRGEQAWLVYVTPARRPTNLTPWISFCGEEVQGIYVYPGATRSGIADRHGFFSGFRVCRHSNTACCRIFWDRHKDNFQAGQIAQRLNLVSFVEHDTYGEK